MSATTTSRRKRPVTAADREQRDHERREQLEAVRKELFQSAYFGGDLQRLI